ncbi:MAG: alpha/beta fold hydrolase [Hyphomicrobiaceae bacterium]|nr:alpha/beta fold hydrolase [Hyphomicrobiaceae bacterium]
MVWLPRDLWIKDHDAGIFPAVEGDNAVRLFCLPALSNWRHPEQNVLTQRARYYLRNARWERVATPIGQLQAYIFEPDDGVAISGTVLLVHGWTGEASFMTALAEPIRRAGFRVVLLDLPAHGHSEGRSTNLMECARAVVFVHDALGPFEAVVTHSFGSMIALLAAEGVAPMPHGFSTSRFVLIASPNELTDITSSFCEKRSISTAGRRAFERRLERIGRRSIGLFNVARLLREARRPALVIHDTKDDDVPHARAEEIVSAVPGSKLTSFTGLGHRNILFAPPVARAVAAYLKAPVDGC